MMDIKLHGQGKLEYAKDGVFSIRSMYRVLQSNVPSLVILCGGLVCSRRLAFSPESQLEARSLTLD